MNKPLLIGLGMLLLGGLITGATYSAADGGGTYVVTTGLFLVGGLNLLRGIWLRVKEARYRRQLEDAYRQGIRSRTR